MKKASNLEKVLGSLPASTSTTALAVYLGSPLAALIPVLVSTLANNRHKERIASALQEIETRLSKIENLRELLTDAQFLLIGDLVASILNTPDDEKLCFLKTALYETPYQEMLTMHDAKILARALNDISVGELAFLIECHGRKLVFNKSRTDGYYNIEKSSSEGEAAIGLINLGLLSRSVDEGTAADVGAYQFTRLAEKLVDLISNQSEVH